MVVRRLGGSPTRAVLPSLEERVSAVVTAARRVGVPARSPRVIHDGYNLMVHLAPLPVVARVMTLFPGDDADHWRGVAAREVAVAAHLQRGGVPVVAPPEGVDPGPHDCGDACFTLWTLADMPGEGRPDPQEFAALLQALESGMASYAGGLPALGAWRQAPRPASAEAIRAAGADLESAVWLQTVWDTLDARLAALPARTLVPAHGDAHVRNLVRSGGGWAWCDFEDASLMPPHWDLACAVFRGPLLGEEAEWTARVQRLRLGAAVAPSDRDAFGLAMAVRTVQSVCGGLEMAVHGQAVGASALRRLDAARRFLEHLELG